MVVKAQDLFPVSVAGPDGVQITARGRLVQIVGGPWRLYGKARDYPNLPEVDGAPGIVLVCEMPMDATLRTTSHRRYLLGPDGAAFTIHAGCAGCAGNKDPLKRFRPR